MSEHKDFEIYTVGVCHASICTSLPIGEAVIRANGEHPAGTTTDWKFSEDSNFASGQSNPCPCERNPETHKHYLLVC